MFADMLVVRILIVFDEAADNEFDHIKSPSFLIPSIIAEIGRDTSNNEKEIDNKRNAKKS